jgi:hypothetical protein
MDIRRIIPLSEVAATEHYADMAKLAVIFNHDIIETYTGTWRWRENGLVCHLHRGQGPFYDGKVYTGDPKNTRRGSIDLNILWLDLLHGKFTVEEMMKFYMQIGYSLSGYEEVWGSKEAYEFNLPDALQPTSADAHGQTIIEYMISRYDGQVLHL